jgi:hypothetical protein
LCKELTKTQVCHCLPSCTWWPGLSDCFSHLAWVRGPQSGHDRAGCHLGTPSVIPWASQIIGFFWQWVWALRRVSFVAEVSWPATDVHRGHSHISDVGFTEKLYSCCPFCVLGWLRCF